MARVRELLEEAIEGVDQLITRHDTKLGRPEALNAEVVAPAGALAWRQRMAEPQLPRQGWQSHIINSSLGPHSAALKAITAHRV